MANLTETSTYEAGIYRLETSDPVVGGESGVSNQQAKQLANRTKYLKDHTDDLEARRGLSFLRNCVLAGPTNSSGAPDIVSKTGDRTLAINAETSANTPGILEGIKLSFAYGWDAKGQVDFFHNIDTDVAEIDIDDFVSTGLTDIFLFAERNTLTGAVTLKVDTGPFVFSPVEPSSDQHYWWNSAEMLWRKYAALPAPSWSARQIVLIARITRDGSGDINEIYHYQYRESNESESSIPVATIMPMHVNHNTPPLGWLHCNGANVSRTVYARLYAAIGTSYGVGDGSTTFKLPDLRAEFIRGLDASRGVDTGRTLGSTQADDFKAHTHLESSWAAAGSTTIGGAGGNFGSAQTGSTGGTETRPRNVAYPFLIKY